MEMWTDRQMDKKRTNERTELHQFQKEPSYDGDVSMSLGLVVLKKKLFVRT